VSFIDLDKSGRRPQGHRTYLGPSLGWIITDEPTYVEFVIGSSVDIAPGLKNYLLIPEWLIVKEWDVLSSAAGFITFDIWKVTLDQFLAGTVPGPTNSITGMDKPRLFNQFANSSQALTGWNVLLQQNDVIAINVDTSTGIRRATLVLQCLRSLGQG